MSRIINPHNPLAPPRNYIGELMNTMRIIAAYRENFFKLEALKQDDGVSPPATARELLLINEEQQYLMSDMVTFILYGDKNERCPTVTGNRETPAADSQENAQESAEAKIITGDASQSQILR